MMQTNIMHRNKAETLYIFLLLLFTCNYFFWGISWFNFVTLLGGLLSIVFYFQWRIFNDAVSRQRLTKQFLIIHTNSPKSINISKRIEEDALKRGVKNPIILSSSNFYPFSMLYQATAIVFVIDDSYVPTNDSFFTFLSDEVIQRQKESAYKGYKENIVYTKEGKSMFILIFSQNNHSIKRLQTQFLFESKICSYISSQRRTSR